MRSFLLRSLYERKFTRRPSRQYPTALRMEALEVRDVPATISLASGTLSYTAGAGVNNNTSVTISGADFIITDSAEPIDASGVAGATGSGTNTVTVPTAGVTAVALDLGDGADAIAPAGVLVTTQGVAVGNSGSLLSVGGPVTTTTGNVGITGSNAVVLSADVNAGSGTITIGANQDGAGAEGVSQTAGLVSTTNTTAAAVSVAVNTAGGGTGDASLDNVTAGNGTGGRLSVASNGGSVLYAGTTPLDNFLRGVQGNGGTTPARLLRAGTYAFTATGAGSVGTDARPIQSDNLNATNTGTFAAGSGGVYWTDWGSVAFGLASASATGAGGVRVVTANANGHNLSVTGPVTTGSGNIFLAADDNFTLSAAVGGAGFSGTVYLAGNRDTGNTATLNMNAGASITTTNATADAVLLQSFNTSGTRAGGIVLNNITTGDGGTVTANAASIANSQGLITVLNNTVVVNTGPTGRVVLTAAAQGIGGTAQIGTAAAPVRVTAGTVVATSTTSSIGPTTGATNNGSIFVTGTGPTAFTASIGGTGAVAGAINLATAAGPLTVAGPVTTTNAGAVTLTSAGANGGVVINAPIGDANTGNIIVNAGANPATLNVTQTLLPTTTLAVTAANGLVVSSTGVVTGTAAATNATPVTVRAGGLLTPAGAAVGTLNLGNTAVAGGTVRLDLNTTAAFDKLAVAGTADVTGGDLRLFVNGSFGVGDSFVILSNDGADAVVGRFAGGTTVVAANDPRLTFTIDYAGGDGNDVVATLTAVVTTSLLDVSGGAALFASGDGLNNTVTVTRSNGAISYTDAAGPIALSAGATAAGFTGGGTNTVTGPEAALTSLSFALNTGADTLAALDAGTLPVTIGGTGTLAVAGVVSATGTLSATGFTDITGTAAGVFQVGSLTLGATNAIGTPARRVNTAAAAVTASAGAGGVFLAEADGANVTATATGSGNVDVLNTTGTLTVAGTTSTATGNISLSSGDGIALAANVNAGSGTVTIAANTDGVGAQGVAQSAGTVTTTNTTAGAASVTVNTAAGGTGDAAIDSFTVGAAAGGTLTVTSNGGSVLYAGEAALTTSQQGLTNGGAAPARVVTARDYVLTATGAGSIGTDARPIQAVNFGTDAVAGGSNFTLSGGSGGVFLVKFGGVDLTLAGASATGAGNVRVVTGNVGGNSVYVTGTVTAGSGNIHLAADDDFRILAGATIGGAGFSGNVFLQANRDLGTAGQPFTMEAGAKIVTTSTAGTPGLASLARTPATQAVYIDIGGDAGNPSLLTVSDITVGDGGMIVLDAAPRGPAAGLGGPEAGVILQAAGTALNAGPTGTVVLNASITAATTADAIGTAAQPVVVTAGTVVATSNFGRVYVTDAVAGNFTVTVTQLATGQTATTGGPSVNLATTAGALTIAGPTASVAGGVVNLAGAGGVVLSAAVGSATTGPVAISGPLSGTGTITLGTGGLTLTQDADSTYAGVIDGPQGITKAGTGTLTFSGANTYTGPTTVAAGGLLVGNATGSATGTGTVTGADGATLGGSGTVAGAVSVGGTLSPGGGGNAAGTLATGDLSFAGAGAQVLAADLNGTAAGTGYDQVAVTGSVNLTGATLTTTVAPGFTPAGNTQFTLVANDGTDPVTGTFAGLAEGATVTAGGGRFTISYAGGDGNDVVLTVTPVATPPVNTVPGAQSAFEDRDLVFSAAAGNAVSVADGGPGAPLRVTLTATQGVLTLTGTAGLTFTDGDGTADAAMTFTGTSAAINAALDGLRFTPAADYNGPATVTISTDDQGAGSGAVQSDTDSVAVAVAAVNDAPAFNLPTANVTVIQDSAARTVPGFATGITAGPANESGQTLAFLVSTDNPALFAAGPWIAADGTLTFTPAAGASGSATVTVRLRDDGGVADGGADTSAVRTFTITVTAPTATSVTLTASPNTTTIYGTAVTLTATVAAAGGTASPAAGRVEFYDNGTLLGTATEVTASGNGFSTFTYTTSPTQLRVNGGAAHVISATYYAGPGSGFAGSTSSGAGNASQTVTPRGLTVDGVTAADKVYDATTAATVTAAGATLTGVLSGDLVTLTTDDAAGVFATEDVGTGIAVAVSGLTIGGASAGNYTLTQPTTAADITPFALTVTGVVANDKMYDGTTASTLDTAGAAPFGVFAGDSVTLETAGATGTFATRNVGTGIAVAVSGLAVSGTDARNYTLTQPTASASITPRTLTVTAVANTKPFDGTTTAAATPIITAGSLAAGDTAAFTETYVTPDPGNGKTLTPTGVVADGNGGSNYAVTFVAVSTGVITIPGVVTTTVMTSRASVVYGTAVTFTATLSAADGTPTGSVAFFDDTTGTALGAATFQSSTGTTATYTYTTGPTQLHVTSPAADAIRAVYTPTGNFSASTGTLAGGQTVTPFTLTTTGVTANDKVYDRTTAATVNTAGASLVGVFAGDSVTLGTGGATGTFASANVGTAIPVAVSGLTLGGSSASDYTLAQPTTSASITPRDLTATGITANNKVYDGTTAATLNTAGAGLDGVIAGDAVTLSTAAATGTFATRNVGANIPVSVSGLTLAGGSAGNYTLTQPVASASITPRGLTATGITANDKVYDRTTTATLNTGGAVLVGVIAGDAVTLSPAGATGTFASRDVGAGIVVTVSGLTVSGTDARNYTLTQPVTSASVTPRGLTATGVTANDKVYDRTTTATVNAAGAALAGVIAGDAVTLAAAGATGTFATANAGTNIAVAVSGLATAGAQAGNYVLTQPVTAASITPRALSVGGVAANDKVYDRTTTATVNAAGAVLNGVLAGDAVALAAAGATGTFATTDVGVNIPVAVSGLTLAGGPAGNYTLTQPTAAARITPRGLTVSGVAAAAKVYDGTTAAAVDAAGAVLVGVLAGDAVTLSTAGAAGAFVSRNVGVAIPVAVSGLAIGGNRAGNYTLAQATASAAITPRPITVTAAAGIKTFDGTTTAAPPVVTAGSLAAGDAAAFTATFDTPDPGTGKPVTPGGVVADGNGGNNYAVTFVAATGTIRAAGLAVYAGVAVGGDSVVTTFDRAGTAGFTTDPFPGFAVGVRTAVGDVNGDGTPDIVVGTGPGTVAGVRVFDGKTRAVLFDATPFDDFTGGVFVAVGDIDGDGRADVIVTPDQGGGPRVSVFRGGDFVRIADFFGIDDPGFRGGARATAGDLNGDGAADLMVSAGAGGGPRVSVYDGAALARGQFSHLVGDFFLFEAGLRNGAYLAAADVDGDGVADLVGGAGPGGGPRVLVVSGRKLLAAGPAAAVADPVANFFAGDPNNRGGVRVAGKNLDRDRYADVVAGAGEGGGSGVTAYLGKDLIAGGSTADFGFDAFPGVTNGVFVG